MSVRTVLAASIVAGLLVAGCGGDDDTIATSDSAPATLGELDDVVITVAPQDLSGEPVRLEDTDDDGEVEIVEAEVIDDDGEVTRIDETAGSDDADDPGSSEDVTEQSDSEDGDSEDGGVEDSDSQDDDSQDNGLNPFGGDDPEDGRMPDVVCMGLQDAQNEIQDRGVFFSKSEDATGDGRRQILDRNWIVVAQDPAPGTPIGENEAVLSVVKKDEDNDC